MQIQYMFTCILVLFGRIPIRFVNVSKHYRKPVIRHVPKSSLCQIIRHTAKTAFAVGQIQNTRPK